MCHLFAQCSVTKYSKYYIKIWTPNILLNTTGMMCLTTITINSNRISQVFTLRRNITTSTQRKHYSVCLALFFLTVHPSTGLDLVFDKILTSRVVHSTTISPQPYFCFHEIPECCVWFPHAHCLFLFLEKVARFLCLFLIAKFMLSLLIHNT